MPEDTDYAEGKRHKFKKAIINYMQNKNVYKKGNTVIAKYPA